MKRIVFITVLATMVSLGATPQVLARASTSGLHEPLLAEQSLSLETSPVKNSYFSNYKHYIPKIVCLGALDAAQAAGIVAAGMSNMPEMQAFLSITLIGTNVSALTYACCRPKSRPLHNEQNV